ncbi:MAG: anion permease [Nitrososphaerota archaeon]|jgi:di/tricarboxylate transporter|nr:anion permease [Nitrososphaerota archaeon]
MNKESIKPKLSVKHVLSLVVGALGILIALIEPFVGLGHVGHIMLGSIVITLATWIFRPGKGTFIVGAIILFLGGSIAGIPMSDLASGFSSASLWLLIPAMFLGYALMKTGLGKRIVFALFKHLKLSYVKILIGWFLIGIVFALITPSITVRFLILTPIAVVVADACGIEKHSKGRSLIVISAWAAAIFPGIAWQNGSLFGPVFSSYLPEGSMRDMATSQMWMYTMAPWIIFSLVFLAVLYFVLKPEQKLAMTQAQLSKMYEDLGKISREEKGCIAAFALLFIGLVLQIFLPITTNQVLFAALILLLLLGVLSVKDISQGINWDIVAFFGIILSFSRICDVSGITAWLSPALASLLRPIAGSQIVFVLALYGFCVFLRFFDVTQGWVSSAILAMATPMLFEDFGINPLICIMVFICASNIFFFRYQQPWIGQAESVCGDGGWNSRHLLKAAVAYALLIVIFLLTCTVYWRIIGIW